MRAHLTNGSSYDYAIVRVVPRVEREEFVNVGVIVSCPQKQFLEARIEVDESRLKALDPGIDIEAIRAHLASIPAICAGGCRRRRRRSSCSRAPSRCCAAWPARAWCWGW